MKMTKTLALAATLSLWLPLSSQAREVYQMKWSATVYTTGENGKVIKSKFTEKDIIAEAAADNGLDPKGLAFAYIADVGDTEVVDAKTGETIREIYQFEGNHTDVGSGDGSEVVRQAFIFDELHGGALGSLFGTQKSKHNGEGTLTGFAYKGTFNYSINGAVYSGSFSTGKHIASIN